MESLAGIKAKLASLAQLHDLIRALRALAASHSREAQNALAGTNRYVRIIEEAIAGAATLVEGAASTGGGLAAGNNGVLIAVCSENGFVGGFNEQVLGRAVSALEPGEKLVVIGRRGEARAAEKNLDVARAFAMTTHIGGIPELARHISAHLESAATMRAVYAKYRQGASFDVVEKTILPLSPELMNRPAQRMPPLHQLAPRLLLEKLAAEYFFAELSDILMESFASENTARLRTMEAADNNINDKLEKLQMDERTRRQSEITEELLDVVTGARAVLENPA